MKLSITSPDFSNLLRLEGIVKSLQPEIKLENLNSYLYYCSTENTLTLLIKGAIAYSGVSIPCTITKEGTDQDIAIMIYSGNISHLIENYSDTDKQAIVMTLQTGEKSLFSLKSPSDKVNFAHMVASESEVEGLAEIYTKLNTEESYVQMASDIVTRFCDGISHCLNFIDDDTKNNGIALYFDKMVASDNRHIFVHNIEYGYPVSEDTDYIAIHNKVAKILVDVLAKDKTSKFYISDKVRVVSEVLGFKCVMNNKMAIIAPPNESDLIRIGSTEKITELKAEEFKELVNFFMGFYSNKVNYKTISVRVEATGLRFELKNSGVQGYNSSNVERFKECTIEGIQAGDLTALLLIDSIKDFIWSLGKSDVVTFYMDADHQGAVLISGSEKIYLTKLQ